MDFSNHKQDFPSPKPSGDESLDKGLFVIEQRIYTWWDVLCCGEFLGLLQPIWKKAKQGLLASSYADSIDDAPTREAMQSAADNLRYHFNLITAEEAENWLTIHDLSLEDLHEFIYRNLLLEKHKNNQMVQEEKCSPQEILEILWSEIILEDSYCDIVVPLLIRSIVKETQDIDVSSQEANEERILYCQREKISPNNLSKHIQQNIFLRNSFSFNLHMERMYREFCEEEITRDQCERFFFLMRKRLTKIQYQSLCFSSPGKAREAYLCITEDQESFEKVAERAGGLYDISCKFLEETPDFLQESLFSAPLHQCFLSSPKEGNDWLLYSVLGKKEPSLEDTLVYDRVKESCILERIAPLMKEKGKWLKWDIEIDCKQSISHRSTLLPGNK